MAKTIKGRRFVGGWPRPDRRKIRKEEGEYRQEERNKMGPRDQILVLDARLGKGMGAKRERGMLAKKMAG